MRCQSKRCQHRQRHAANAGVKDWIVSLSLSLSFCLSSVFPFFAFPNALPTAPSHLEKFTLLWFHWPIKWTFVKLSQTQTSQPILSILPSLCSLSHSRALTSSKLNTPQSLLTSNADSNKSRFLFLSLKRKQMDISQWIRTGHHNWPF